MNAVDELNFLLGIGPPRPQLPRTLQCSGYTSVRTLGKGSYGQALLVFHKAQGQYFAVKHVNMAKMTARQRRDAHNEISVLQQLHHPNIVRYVEYFEENQNLYIVMEYADGGDLYSHLQKINRLAGPALLRKGPGMGLLSEAQVISLFVQTTMAVKHMHNRRLLHRDIKSQNVFLTRNHVVKLGDFGIATVLQNTVTMASTMCGTPCYFSPELCQGQPYNNKSDVWALGVLLYELCAGTLPFESTTMKALMREIVHKEPRRIPSAFSDELWRLIQWMLKKSPRERPDVGQVLMQPVLMRRVPDIIAQLKGVELGEVSPRAVSRAKTPATPSKGGGSPTADTPSGAGGGGGVAVADTEPYIQLLAQQQQQQQQPSPPNGRPAAPPSPAVNPFCGSPRPGNAGDGGYASGLGVRPRSPPQVAKEGAGAAAAVMARGAAAHLTPGQRAAQDVLEGRRGRGADARSGQAGPSPPVERPSITELLARFDAEKKRVKDSKKPTAATKLAGLAAGGAQPRRPSADAPPPPPPPPPQLAEEALDPRDGTQELGDMLREMTGYLESFRSIQVVREGAVIALPAPPPAPQAGSPSPDPPPRRGSNGSVPERQKAKTDSHPASPTKPSDFSDPTGAKLDVNALQQQPSPPPAHAPSSSGTASQPHGVGVPSHRVDAAANAVTDKLFRTSFNAKFDESARPSRPPRALVKVPPQPRPEKSSSPTTAAAAAERASPLGGSDGRSVGAGADVRTPLAADPAVAEVDKNHADSPVAEECFNAQCQCGAHNLVGAFSLIYGSFVCSCPACRRASGCGSGGGGVEWLHLPNLPDLTGILAAPTSVAVAAGGGAAAAAALRDGGGRGAAPSATNPNGPTTAATAAGSPRVFTFESVTDESDEEGEGSVSGGGGAGSATPSASPRVGVFDKYFCPRCGCMLAMRHDTLEGLLLAKVILSGESAAALDQFAVAVSPEEDGSEL